MLRILKVAGIVVAVIIVLLLVVTGIVYYKMRHIKDSHDLQERVTKLCLKHIEKTGTPGLFVGIIQGDKMYMRGFGYADLASGRLTDTNTIFEIGSISKVFTSIMTQQMADARQLKWDDLLSAHLPEGYSIAVDGGTTLRHLASHTSGFPRLPALWFPQIERNECDPYSTLSPDDLKYYLAHDTDKKAPTATGYDYSNLGAGLLGHVLEWRSGIPYDTLLQQYICHPLAMKNTSLLCTDTALMATAYDAEGKATCHWHMPILFGAGAIRSSGADMMRFLKAVMDTTSTVGQATQKLSKTVADIPGGAVGCGWHIDDVNGAVFNTGPIIWHNGNTGGFSSYIGFYPGKGKGVVLLSNRSESNLDRLAISMLLRLNSISLE